MNFNTNKNKFLYTLLFLIIFVSKKTFSQVEITSTGTSTGYVVSVPGVFPLRNGIEINFRAHVACGANPTLDVSGTGPSAIMKNGSSTNLIAGDIVANQVVKVVYDGSKWQLISPTANTSNGTVTSVGISAPSSLFTVSGSPVTNSGTLTLGFQTLSSNLFFASPNGLGGVPSFRGILSGDLPLIPLTKGGTNASLSAVNGGVVYSDASAFGITSAGTSGQVLQSNGAAPPSWVSPSFLPSGTSGQTLRHDGTGWLANSFLFNDGTKIGVGTTSPPTLMSISTGFAPLYSTILSSAATTNSTTLGGIYFADTQLPGTAQAGIYGYRDGASSSGSDLPTRLSFYTTSDGSSATTERVRIDNSGNVGIGDGINGGVSSRFVVSDATSNRLVSLIQSETGSTSTGTITGTLGLKVGISSDGTEQKTGISAAVTGSGTGQQNAVYATASGSATGGFNRGVVASASNNSITNVGGDFFSTGNSGENYAVRAYTGGSQSNSKYGLYISSSGAGTRYGVYATGEDINYFSNKIGIGTATPGATLHVAGTARITALVGPGTVIADASGNLSVATGGTTTGSGTQNYVARWTSASSLGTGVLMDDGTIVKPNANNTVDLGASAAAWKNVYINGRLYVEGSSWTSLIANNTFIGIKSIEAVTTGLYNLGVGQGSGKSITTGLRNTMIGHRAGELLNTGSDNTMVGHLAGGLGNPGINNTFIGSYAGYGTNNTASDNTLVGSMVGGNISTGSGNTSMGTNSLYTNTTGSSNTAVGRSALSGNQTASNNSALGYTALNQTTGASNTGIGYFAGYANTTGTQNTFLGFSADAGSANLSQATAIGANAIVSQSNSVILGNSADVGIGTSAPLARLNISEALGYSLLGSNPVDAQVIIGTNANQRLYLGSYYTAGVGAASMIQSADFYSSVDNPSSLALQPIGGNVGIGTSNPTRKFYLVDGGTTGAVADGNSMAVFEDNGNSYVSLLTLAANENGILFGNPGNSQDGGIIYNNASTLDGLQFRTNGNLTRMVIDNVGEVGIGTVAPAYKLHVENSVASSVPVGYFKNTNTTSTDGIAVLGESILTSPNYGIGVKGNGNYIGVFAQGNTSGYAALYSTSAGSTYAGFFQGNVNISGTLSKGGGSFKIDHPLDPENKILYHSFVESPDMMNVYNGNIVTDGNGLATVNLPDYFQALNKDFRYQLTIVGSVFAQAIVFEKIANNKFTIKTDKPNIEVSWQVTGIRKDPWAEKNRIPTTVEKNPDEKGFYLHPKEYGMPEEKGIDFKNNNRINREKKQ